MKDDQDGGHDEDRNGGMLTQSEVELQIIAFALEMDPSVREPREVFKKKLEDVQYDIAALKRAVHDPESLGCGVVRTRG